MLRSCLYILAVHCSLLLSFVSAKDSLRTQPPLEAVSSNDYDALITQVFQAWKQRSSSPEESQHTAFSLLQQAKGLEADSEELNQLSAYCYTVLGDIARVRDKFEQADSLHSRALFHAKQLTNQTSKAQAYRNLGLVALGKNNLEGAITYFLEAISIFNQLGQPGNLAACYFALAEIYIKQGDPGQALDVLDKSIALFRETENVEELTIHLSLAAATMGDLPFSEFRQGKRKTALRYLAEAESYLAQVPDTRAPFYYYLYQGSFWGKPNNRSEYWGEAPNTNYQQALNNFALAEAKMLGNAPTEAKFAVYYNLAEIHTRFRRYDQALEHLLKACELVEDTVSSHFQMKVQQKYAYIFKELGDFESAYGHTELRHFFQEEVQNEDMRLENIRLGEQLKVEENKKRAAEAVLAKERTQYGLFGVLGLLLAGAVLTWFGFRHTRQKHELREQAIRYESEISRQTLLEALKEQEVRTLNVAVDSQEAERKRIAQELHDAVGGTMSALTVMSSAMQKKLQDQPQATRNMVQRFYHLLDQTVKEVRQISHAMAAKSLQQGSLHAAINDLAETLRMSKQYSVNLAIDSLLQAGLEETQEIHLYRIVQEIIQNTVKHAQATQLSIRTAIHGQQLTLETQDNGKGFVYHSNQPLNGIGMSNIESRVQSLGGKWRLHTSPGQGVQILIEIPIRQSVSGPPLAPVA